MDLKSHRPRVAVVGSGISGLTAAHFLKDKYDVTILERNPKLGMGSHSIEVHGAILDAPLRFFDSSYYPNLLKLYIDAGIRFSSRCYSFSGVDFATQRLLWRCNSVRVAPGHSRFTADFFTICRNLLSSTRMLYDSFRLKRQLHALRTKGAQTTLGQYMAKYSYSEDFLYQLFLPFMAVTMTCSYEEVLATPMDVIADYVASSGASYNLQRYRIDGSTNTACLALSAGCEVLLNTTVHSVIPCANGVRVGFKGVLQSPCWRDFDQVVMAVEAPHVSAILQGIPDCPPADSERELYLADIQRIFSQFKYTSTRMVTHTDRSLLPENGLGDDEGQSV